MAIGSNYNYMDNQIFELAGIYFSYLGRFPALSAIDIRISRGQRISIIGANGSGKSTFLQLLDGLIFADQGKIKFCGQLLNEKNLNHPQFSREFRRRVGFLFQNSDVQLFCPTVKDDIVFGPLNLGFAKTQIQKRLDELVEVLGLKELLERPAYQLSIGEKRKVAIASVLISDPEVLILDEPTAGLDPMTTRIIMDLLTRKQENGRTVITATHDLHIVEEISELVYVFGRDKSIVKSGLATEILADSELLKANNLLHIHSHRHEDKVHAHAHLHSEHHLHQG